MILSTRMSVRIADLYFSETAPSILLAASEDSGIHAGQVLKNALSQAGGRGGGTQSLAQGSLPTKDAFSQVLASLRSQLA